MRKLLFVSICLFGISEIFAGGIVTNTNQSASWARNPSTAATTGIEAVYYNPAATTKFGNGLFVSISNQSIFQKREIENSYPALNQSLYKGTVNAPLFPSLYAAYNFNNFSVSFGFNPVGGGGSAEFTKGLPSFETNLASLVPKFANSGVTGYSLEAYFKGSSIYFGYQFGISYKINDLISVYGGLRYVTAKNTYEGYLRNMSLIAGGNSVSPSTFLIPASNLTYNTATSLNPLVSAAPNITLDQAVDAGYLPSTDATAIKGGLLGFGLSQEQVNAMSVTQVQGTFYNASFQAAKGAGLMRNQEADAEQTGSGICPIIGINISPNDKLNIGLKYEFATKMEVKNKTAKDFVVDSIQTPATAVTMFPNEAKTPADMPALLSIGISYKATEKLGISTSCYYYFDKAVKYGKKSATGEFVSNDELIDNNFIDIAVGLEYQLTEKLLLSTGFLYGKTGVKPEYNSDVSFSNSSTTFGIGGKYAISPKMDINLGFAYTTYQKQEKIIASINATETYLKNTMIIAAGIDIKLGK